MKLVVGITGASGSIYGIRFLQILKDMNIDTHLIISEHAKKIIEYETLYPIDKIKILATKLYKNDDLSAVIASGTFKFDAIVIIPCSISTLSKIANGIADNLITRVATVALKERRKIILVIRETPLSSIHLENMLKLSYANAVILPASPAFYTKPKNIDDIVEFIISKIMNLLEIEYKSPIWHGFDALDSE